MLLSESEIQEIVRTGEQLPADLVDDDLTQELLVNPVFDGEKVVEGDA